MVQLRRHNRGIATSSVEPRGFCGVFEQLTVSFEILADAQMASEPDCEQPGLSKLHTVRTGTDSYGAHRKIQQWRSFWNLFVPLPVVWIPAWIGY